MNNHPHLKPGRIHILPEDVEFVSNHNPQNFKPGDVVRLKSGSPSMTVSEIGTGDYCEVCWFEQDTLHRQVLALAIIEKDA